MKRIVHLSQVREVGRAAYLVLAALQGWILGGAGAIGLVVGSGLPVVPRDPGVSGTEPEGWWHPDLYAIAVGFTLLALAAPAAAGFVAMLNPRVRYRTQILWTSGMLMVVLGVTLPAARAAGWHF